MKRFVAKHADKIEGVLNGFDRLVLRGTLRTVAYARICPFGSIFSACRRMLVTSAGENGSFCSTGAETGRTCAPAPL